MKKWLLGLLLSLALVFALAACGSDDGDDAKGSDDDNAADTGETDDGDDTSDRIKELQEDGVVIGFADEKPYAYEEDGELKGVAVDVATAVLNELGIDDIEGKLSDFSEMIPSLRAGKFDIITASMAITGERCENVDFGEPEVLYGEGLIVKAGNPLDIHSYADIADNPDITVSIMQGATEIGFAKELGVEDSQIQEAPDIPATFSAVASDRADATTGTEMTIKMALESADNPDLEFVEDFEQPPVEGNPSYGAAAFSQDDDALREAYNEKLAELKATDKYGELLEANYFSATANAVDTDITTEDVCSGAVYEDR